MRFEFAHLRERSTSGQLVDFAIFNNTDSARGTLLSQLTVAARANHLKIDAAALAYEMRNTLSFKGWPRALSRRSN